MRARRIVVACSALFVASCGASPPSEPPRTRVPPLSAAAAAAAGTRAAPAPNAEAKEENVTEAPRRPASFDEDVAFLSAHGKVIVLSHPDGGKVALSPLLPGTRDDERRLGRRP
jgi:hypothetical protein